MRRVLLLLPLLLVPACSGGGGGEEADPKAAFVRDASVVCERASGEFEALTTPTAPAGFAPFVRDTVAVVEKAQLDLEELTRPPDDAAELDRKVLEPLAALVEEGKAYAVRVEAAGTDQAKLLPLLSQRPTGKAIDRDYLRSYGLGVCADAVDQAG